MSWQLYVQLSLMMFLQFAVWGAWSPVLASRLLGPLKMSGKQTGWIYGTIYIGCIISPLIAGQIADRWVATQYFLAAAHLAGGVLLLASARQRHFPLLFAIMLLYALAFAPTLALVNSLELWFSILARRFLQRGDFSSPEVFEELLCRFLDDYNTHHAHPFRWTYTGQPLVRGTPFSATRRQQQHGKAWFSPRRQLFERLLYPPRPYHHLAV